VEEPRARGEDDLPRLPVRRDDDDRARAVLRAERGEIAREGPAGLERDHGRTVGDEERREHASHCRAPSGSFTGGEREGHVATSPASTASPPPTNVAGPGRSWKTSIAAATVNAT